MPVDSEEPHSKRVAGSFLRARRLSLASAEGYSVGLVWLGYLLVGYWAGSWLDRRFHTDYWLPILVLAAAAEGFRQIFVMAGRMARQDKEKARSRTHGPIETIGGEVHPNWKTADKEDSTNSAQVEREGQGDAIPHFRVPPPPTSEFEKRREKRDEH